MSGRRMQLMDVSQSYKVFRYVLTIVWLTKLGVICMANMTVKCSQYLTGEASDKLL